MKSTVVLVVLAAALGAARAETETEMERERQQHGPAMPAAHTRARAEELSAQYWQQHAAARIQQRLADQHQAGVARNVIVFLGDGMSVPTLAAARALLGGEEAELSFETFPTVGLTKTYCVNAQVADSACSATAYLCGAKTNQGMLGLTAAVPRGDCAASLSPDVRVSSVAAWALADGRDAGIVTTTRVTHASPAGAFATAANRNWESDADLRAENVDPVLCPDIADQLINHYPGNQFKVILGGGRQEFLPNDTLDEEGSYGRRLDGRNLISEWAEGKRSLAASYKYVWNRSELLAAIQDPPEYLLGLFESSHLQYHLEGPLETEPTLAEQTEAAIRVLSRNPQGFFLFVEGGRIDHGHHDNYVHLALDETLQFAEAVQRAVDMLDPAETLIVVTADHAHVMSYNGYAPRGTSVLDVTGNTAQDGLPYMTLSYTNGPGARPRTYLPEEEGYGTLRWRSTAEVPLDSETHGGDDVAVFALGPHHHMFSGVYEQSDIPHLIAYAACLGDLPTACSSAQTAAASIITTLALLFVVKMFTR